MAEIDRLTKEYQRDLQDRVTSEPAKNFFVHMLTRDIELIDAILDLLDNCTDGVQRTLQSRLGSEYSLSTVDYAGFRADIVIEPDYFSITDNCGGISVPRAKESAFRLGRPPGSEELDDDIYTIGTYGIGMKRAMFKLGRFCRVVSGTGEQAFEVLIPPEWFGDEVWKIPFEEIDATAVDVGTKIEVVDLVQGVADEFSKDLFISRVKNEISELFGYIIQKGFLITVNGNPVIPSITSLRFTSNALRSGKGIAPFVFKGSDNGVDVEIVVGFYRPLLTEEEIEKENRGNRVYTREDAGWTVICNDRIVVYGDKTELTGWGVSRVPRFHNQFISISGVVFFYSRDADALPLTTTKRGLDGGSSVWLRARDRMIEGVKPFTAYTNQWKRDLETGKQQIADAEHLMPRELIAHVLANAPEENWRRVRDQPGAKRFVPTLPTPRRVTSTGMRQIKYSKNEGDIKKLGNFLFEDDGKEANEIGSASFDYVLSRIPE